MRLPTTETASTGLSALRGAAGIDLGDPFDTALAGLRRLAEKERSDGRVAVASRGDLVDERLALPRGLGEDADRLVGAPEFQQRHRGVHAVAVLVRLRPQRLAERADGLVRRDRVAHRARRAGRRRCAG